MRDCMLQAQPLKFQFLHTHIVSAENMKGSKIDCINPPGHPPQLLHRAALSSLAVSYVQYGGERGERGEGQVWREGGVEGGCEGKGERERRSGGRV